MSTEPTPQEERHPGDLTGEAPSLPDAWVDECHNAGKHEIGRWRLVGPMAVSKRESPTGEAWMAIDDNRGSTTSQPLVGFEEAYVKNYNRLYFQEKKFAIEFIHWRATRAVMEHFLLLSTDLIGGKAADASSGASPSNEGEPTA